MSTTFLSQASVSRFVTMRTFLVVIAFALLILVFRDGLRVMVEWWLSREEYSHGILIPFISCFLIWQKRYELIGANLKGEVSGLIAVLAGIGLLVVGELATIYSVIQYGFIVTLIGMFVSFIGWRGVRVLWAPLIFLVFMVPLPNFFYNSLSSELQLISSQLGVAVIRLFGISVYLEGNVIDLGGYQLQVVEACSGLRYLFPLTSLAFLCAYLYKGPIWQRLIIFLSSIPITIFMNSFRIGVIGVLVEYWGTSMAEGFLHDFEGWIVFMASLGLLLAEIWVFVKLSKQQRSFSDVFGIGVSRPTSEVALDTRGTLPKPFIYGVLLMLFAVLGFSQLEQRQELNPDRNEFSNFPMKLDEWHGQVEHMDQRFIDALKFDDYVFGNFQNSNAEKVSFYVAYYASQKKGESAHSPKSCIPGGGWRINTITRRGVAGVKVAGTPLRVNRVEIQKGQHRQLVYYWFQQRGRVITNEYAVKWYLFWDALTKNRTDGALVRLTTSLPSHEDIEKADNRLEDFIRSVSGELSNYIPGVDAKSV